MCSREKIPFHGALAGVLRLLFLCVLGVAFSCCSEAPKRESSREVEPKAPPPPATGRFAFQRMYIQARTWAPDVQPLRLSSLNLKQVVSKEGKCGAWQAVFVSGQLRKSRSYTFSVVESPGVREGVLAGREEPWSGAQGPAHPFVLQALKVDSDQAYLTAAKNSSDYLKKHPDVPVLFLLEHTPRHPNPSWRVIWGETVGTSDYSVFVDASTGKYLQTTR